MRKYIVKWKTITDGLQVEDTKIKEFEDVSFRDMYIRATDDDTGETFYIPYTSIYDIKLLKDEGENDQS